MFVLGGNYHRRQVCICRLVVELSSLDTEIVFQISMVQDCKLKHVGEMPFDFFSGRCNTYTFGIMLCSYDGQNTCFS